MSYNNIYNFKNPIRHFVNIDNLTFSSNLSTMDIDETCWTLPVKFRVLKDEHNFRTLKLPNILQAICAYEHFKDFPEFENPQNLDSLHKRLSPQMETGDFKIGEYDKQLENDFNNLCVYDNLLRLDIKEFYGRIYTHYLDLQGLSDRYITNLNMGATNGLIMGNYISLYFAEQHLYKISNRLSEVISAKNIACTYSYFSDDFYFFCNEHDNKTIIEIFDKVLEEFDLERNTTKVELWNYSTYNEDNLMTRYWKKINYYCNTHFSTDSTKNKLVFINQLIYRSSALRTENQKRVFINNFFKGKYFRELKISKYEFKDYDYHQLCFLMRTSPESMLYCLDILDQISNFNSGRLKDFFDIRYKESLKQPQHDIQLYYFYALNILGFTDIIEKNNVEVLESENQVLISYYIMNDILSTSEILSLKLQHDEKYWFQNYHLILKSPDLLANIDNSINNYLIPNIIRPTTGEKTSAATRRSTYNDFYKPNISAGKALINSIPEITQEVHEYLDFRFAEETELYS